MTKKTTRTRAEAKKVMWEYYRNNKNLLPPQVRLLREEILAQLMNGGSPTQVFRSISTATGTG